MGDSLIQRRKKVGVFGGSFDPIHHGHLQIAQFLEEQATLDEVFFIPAQISPFKTSKPPCASCVHRLEMVLLAIQGLKGMKVLDLECQRPSPSYTIDTILELAKDPSLQLFLILSGNSIENFSSWKNASQLVQIAFPLIADTAPHLSFPFPCERFPMPPMEVSSSSIRRRLEEGLDCGDLLPSSVLNYIKKNHLYGT